MWLGKLVGRVHDKREALGSSPARATFFSSPLTHIGNREHKKCAPIVFL